MCRKGESIFKRKDGRFEGRYIKNYKNGRAVYGYVYARTYEECKKKRNMIKIKQEPIKKTIVKRTKITLNIMLNNWLLTKKNQIKESSYSKYYDLIENNIKTSIGTLKKDKLTENNINNFLRDKLKDGLSPNTVYNLSVILRQVLKHYNINFNIMTIKKKNGSNIALFSKDKETIINNISKINEREQLGIYLSLFLGLREGEVCALKWENIDLSNKIINIKKTVSRIRTFDTKKKTKLIITEPKTENSKRRLPIPDKLLPLLTKLKLDNDFYILTGTKKVMNPRTFYNHYKSFLKKYNLEKYTFHQLRHTFATDCIELGIDAKTLMELLGHSNISTTLSIYVHPSMKKKRDYINQL